MRSEIGLPRPAWLDPAGFLCRSHGKRGFCWFETCGHHDFRPRFVCEPPVLIRSSGFIFLFWDFNAKRIGLWTVFDFKRMEFSFLIEI